MIDIKLQPYSFLENNINQSMIRQIRYILSITLVIVHNLFVYSRRSSISLISLIHTLPFYNKKLTKHQLYCVCLTSSFKLTSDKYLLFNSTVSY